MDFEFIVSTPPDRECIDNFKKSIAQGLINKYGVDKLKKIVEIIETTEKSNWIYKRLET